MKHHGPWMWTLQKLELQGWALPGLNIVLLFLMAWNEQRNQEHTKDGDRQQSVTPEGSQQCLRKGMWPPISCDKKLSLQLSLRAGLTAHAETAKISSAKLKTLENVLMPNNTRKATSFKGHQGTAGLLQGVRGEEKTLCFVHKPSRVQENYTPVPNSL